MSAPLTVRDLVKAIQREVLDRELTPERARILQNHAASLLGNILDEQREADAVYRVVLLAHLRATTKANRARIEAEATEEYARTRAAKDLHTTTTEMLRSLRAYLRSLSDEMRLTPHG